MSLAGSNVTIARPRGVIQAPNLTPAIELWDTPSASALTHKPIGAPNALTSSLPRTADQLDAQIVFQLASGIAHEKRRDLTAAQSAYECVMLLMNSLFSSSPNFAPYQSVLAHRFDEWASVLEALKRSTEAVTACRHAVALKEAALKSIAGDVPLQLGTADTMKNLARLVSQQGSWLEACQILRRSTGILKSLVGAAPTNSAPATDLRLHLIALSQGLAKLGHYSQSLPIALESATTRPGRWHDLFEAAKCITEGMDLLDRDSTLAAPERQNLIASHAENALRLLEKSVPQSPADRQHLKRHLIKDKESHILESYEAFKQLRDRL